MFRSHEHATDTQNNDNGNLGAATHMQVPDQCHRKESNSQVCNGGTNTIQVRNTDEGSCTDAGAMGVRLRTVPEVVDRGALEYGEAEEDETNDGG